MPSLGIGARITHRAVREFLRGVGASRWRIAYGRFSAEGRLARVDGKRHQGMVDDQVIDLIPYLRSKNAEAMSIYIGPMDHEVVYTDDVDSAGVRTFDEMGLPILAVVETSPGSHQVWFPIPAGTTAWELSAALCGLVGGDKKAHESGSGLQPRIGRIPGFTNTKPNRRHANGLFPFVRLVRATEQRPTKEQLDRLARLGRGSASFEFLSNRGPTGDNYGTHAAGRAGAAARGKSALRADEVREANNRATGRSESDWREVRRRLRLGATFQQCVDYLRVTRADKSSDYACRTVARAATSSGQRHLVPDDPALQRFCDMYERDRRRS